MYTYVITIGEGGQGFRVRQDVEFRLPQRLFKPFKLPVSLRQQYDAEAFRITARMEDPEVVVRPEYLRFGFRAALKVQPLRPN